MLSKSIGVLIVVVVCSITIPILIINKKTVCNYEYLEDAKTHRRIENIRICIKEGNVDAAVLLSELYAKGDMVEKNHSKAIEIIKKMAESGNGRAMIQIADLYSCYGREHNNYEEAAKWYKKAINKDDNYSEEAKVGLAKFYIRKYYSTQNPNDSALYISWLHKIAGEGNIDAMHLLASEYQEGRFVKQDYYISIDWLKKAAAKGSVKAHRAIGNYYANGFFGDADYAQAAFWFQKATEMGDDIAQEFLKSNPSPLGLEVTKATVSDFKKKFKVHKKLDAPNFINGGYTYLVDAKYIPLSGVKNISFVFDKNLILEAVLIVFDKKEYIEIQLNLKRKYKPYVKGSQTLFTQSLTTIQLYDHYVFYLELDTDSYNRDLCTLIYSSRAFDTRLFERNQILIKKLEAEEKRKQSLF